MPRWYWVLLTACLGVVILLMGLALWLAQRGILPDLQNAATFYAALAAGATGIVLVVLNRYSDASLDQERRRDEEIKTMIGLAAEIRSNLERQRRSLERPKREHILQGLIAAVTADPPAGRDSLAALFARDAGPASRIGISDPDNFVYESLKAQVLKLPPPIVGLLVEYYNLNGMLNVIVAQSTAVAKLEPLRRLHYYCSLYELAEAVDAAGRGALTTIHDNLPADYRPTLMSRQPPRGVRQTLSERLIGVGWEPFPWPGSGPDAGGGAATASIETRALALAERSARQGSEEGNDRSDHRVHPPDPGGPDLHP